VCEVAAQEPGGGTEGARTNGGELGKEVQVMSNGRRGGEEIRGGMVTKKEQKHLQTHALGLRVGKERTATMCRDEERPYSASL